MTDPFKITSPTCISFSGGRTSAYMLWRVLQSNGGLPDEAIVCFANTGKEEPATIDFVNACAVNWNVPISWIEYRNNEQGYEVVFYENASRNGEPFEEIIRKRPMLPNPVARFCTVELKIRPMSKFLFGKGFEGTRSDLENFSMIGIRADEPRRAAKITDKSRIPLVSAGVTKEMVGAFWMNQSFDLGLPNNKGVTMHGNCDLCFLKPAAQILSLITENPKRAVWWISMEGIASARAETQKDAGVFRKDRPSYASMLKFSQEQRNIFDENEEGIACFCGD